MKRWSWAPPVRRPRSRAWIGAIVAVALWAAGWRFEANLVAFVTTLAVFAGWLAPVAMERLIDGFARLVGRAIGVVALTVVFVMVIVPLRWIRGGDPLGLVFPGEGSGWKTRPPSAPDARRRWS